MENMSLLTTEMALNYMSVRHNLEAATNVAKQQVDVQTKAASDSHAEMLAEQKRHEDERGTLLTKVDQLQTALDKDSERNLEPQDRTSGRPRRFRPPARDADDDPPRTARQARTQQRDDPRPAGWLRHVCRLRDQRSPGQHQPADGCAAADENDDLRRRLTRHPDREAQREHRADVGRRDESATARIIKTDSSIDPIRVGDIVYSAAWSPNQPTRFALVGKMDVNRDSRDDREELKRMIQEAGGVVDFDLPPHDLGKETGAISPESTGT